jgi:uncharacterized protein DUF6494
MNDGAVNKAVGQFLKNVNFTAQRELEKVVRNALANGKLQPGEVLTASITVAAEKIDLNVTIFSKIEVQ